MNQVREAEEEAGCAIELTGVLRVEYAHDYGRLRVIWAGAWADLAGVLSSHSPHTALCNGI